MNQQNQSPLDKDPIYSRILELIQAGEFNTGIARTISKEYDVLIGESAVRRFRKRHNVQIPGVEKSSTTINGDDAQCTTKPRLALSDAPIVLDDPDTMLRERGLDPADWVIDQITVNEWEGRTKTGNKITNHQAKFTAKRKHPDLVLNPVRSEGWKPIRSLLIPKQDQGQELVVVCGDQQAPFHDKALHDTFCEWLRYNRPSRGVVLGDLLDFPDVSRHPMDPDNVASVQECLQSGYEVFRDYIMASPDTIWQFLLGNHDIRIQRYIIDKAPFVNNLSRVIDAKNPEPEFIHALTHLMRLDELGVELVTTNGSYEDAQVLLSDKLAVRHGWIAAKGSGSSALKTLDQLGYSIIIGHTHRQSMIYHSKHDINRNVSTLTGVEAGCMCKIDSKIDETGRRFPSYTVAPDWQQGWTTACIWPTGEFRLEHATYVNGHAYWRDQRY
jgi:hypothetical protein